MLDTVTTLTNEKTNLIYFYHIPGHEGKQKTRTTTLSFDDVYKTQYTVVLCNKKNKKIKKISWGSVIETKKIIIKWISYGFNCMMSG